jgi:hypothetical protein
MGDTYLDQWLLKKGAMLQMSSLSRCPPPGLKTLGLPMSLSSALGGVIPYADTQGEAQPAA